MDKSLMDLEGMSQPLTKLVEVVADGVGGLYAPFGTVRAAKADAKAMIIRTQAENEAASLRDRAKGRLEYRESIRQENIESISVKAAGELPTEVSDKPVDKDWILQYLNRAQDVSDSDMQLIWARILAGEVASPGSYSKRTLQSLETLDKEEAIAFTKLCSLAHKEEQGWNLLFDDDYIRSCAAEALNSNSYIDHFITIGLIGSEKYSPGNSDISGTKLSYFGEHFELVGPKVKQTPNLKLELLQLPVSFRVFTQIGQQLSQISGAEPNPDFMHGWSEYIKEKLEIDVRVIIS
ncbi:DUF2806 domain-containing protein [Pseudomonas sp. 5Ae-yellow]|uniref:DUF2806 domain-containing protein n=1 Tax=Pseudomonas sp. 5Ae-yellow TaxID=2759848 RepID=UPI0015F61306|nr:DUF2806 domain-containing protein [Pseudomonas sp. 5Ae-yellow]MBA6421117.1 DUF2806 domain-containing protein [Pseudomonas sp. 5Ae-yellow]